MNLKILVGRPCKKQLKIKFTDGAKYAADIHIDFEEMIHTVVGRWWQDVSRLEIVHENGLVEELPIAAVAKEDGKIVLDGRSFWDQALRNMALRDENGTNVEDSE